MAQAPVDISVAQQVRYAGIRPKTESGKPAQVYTDDTPLADAVKTDSGDGVGSIENFVQDAGDGGSSFDVVLKPGAGGVSSSFTLAIDADKDSGETRIIGEQYSINVAAEEAASLEHPAPVVEPLT